MSWYDSLMDYKEWFTPSITDVIAGPAVGAVVDYFTITPAEQFEKEKQDIQTISWYEQLGFGQSAAEIQYQEQQQTINQSEILGVPIQQIAQKSIIDQAKPYLYIAGGAVLLGLLLRR